VKRKDRIGKKAAKRDPRSRQMRAIFDAKLDTLANASSALCEAARDYDRQSETPEALAVLTERARAYAQAYAVLVPAAARELCALYREQAK
jgi:hypothetical protein